MTTSGKACRAPATDPVPYERQHEGLPRGACGAAALGMVYRSFGRPASQAGLWAALGPTGRRGTPTHCLARHALRCGIGALVVQARDPWRLLRQCCGPSVRAVLNHRLTFFARAGHFSVLVGVTDTAVFVHDPLEGPRRRISRSELDLLWRAGPGETEISGHVLVAFTDAAPARRDCPVCGVALPLTILCPACRAMVPLHPAVVLGCADPRCPGRIWARVFCPECDTGIELRRPDGELNAACMPSLPG